MNMRGFGFIADVHNKVTFVTLFEKKNGDSSHKSIQITLPEVNANGCSVKAYVL